MKTILAVIDVQRDFFSPEGSLYVSGGEELPARIVRAADAYDAVIFTLDWHPADHCSFKENGGIWPAHCVAYTSGAGLSDEFTPVLSGGKARLFFKGTDSGREQYGAFEDFEEGSDILPLLKKADRIDVCGIAGDYCVMESAKNLVRIAGKEKVRILEGLTVSIDGGKALTEYIEKNLI